MRVIASLEDPAVIKRILAHLDQGPGAAQHPEHPPRAPPQFVLPGLRESAAGTRIRRDAGPATALRQTPLAPRSTDPPRTPLFKPTPG